LIARRSFAAQGCVVVLLVLALRLPFLNQAVQGDDFYYLKGAEHARIDALHPSHARYVFQGRVVDMRGHPHPPLNSWYLAGLLAITGDESEVLYHTAYLVWSVAAALGMLWLARRFVPDRALAATFLFCVTLPFVVNGTSLEADLPLLGCWMVCVAAFVAAVDRRSEALALVAMVAGVLAGLMAYQALVLAPILAVYGFVGQASACAGLQPRTRRTEVRRRLKSAPLGIVWLPLVAAPLAILAYQLFERLSSGSVPASVLAGYMQSERLQQLSSKVRNAVALTGHMGWILFPALAIFAFRPPRRAWYMLPVIACVAAAFYDPNPIFWVSIGAGSLVLTWCSIHPAGTDSDTVFLASWVLIFFASALAIFFAGSARYLLPISAPVAILAARCLPSRWLYVGAAANGILAISLAIVNYQHWNGYRQFVSSISNEFVNRRVWINGEWGLRHYAEASGGLPLERDRPPRAGDLILTSAYAGAVSAPHSTIGRLVITSAIPLRIVALGAKSGYSSVAFGLRPFDISRAPIDVLQADVAGERNPTLSRVTIGTPEAAGHIISGVFNNDRWMSERAVVLLRRSPGATRVQADLYVPPNSPARKFTMSVNGADVAHETFAAPGKYTLSGPAPPGDPATIVVTADRTFTAPPDTRALSALLLDIGFE
jgi:hypothetical protein